MALKKRNKVSAEFSMSSLTDIIFLLLIFFMLTSSLVNQNALNLKLPSSSSTTVAPMSSTVSINGKGQYFLNGKRMSLRDIESELRNAFKGSRTKASLTIEAENTATVDPLVKVMDIANRLKIDAVLAVQPIK